MERAPKNALTETIFRDDYKESDLVIKLKLNYYYPGLIDFSEYFA